MYDKRVIGFKEAKGAIEAMIQEVKNGDYWQVGVFAIVDEHGTLVHFARMDNASTMAVNMALRKAYSAAYLRRSVREMEDFLEGRPWGISAYGDNLTLVPGGVPIIEPRKEETDLPIAIGAIGVSGVGPFDKDEAVAMVGLRYIQNVLWPSK